MTINRLPSPTINTDIKWGGKISPTCRYKTIIQWTENIGVQKMYRSNPPSSEWEWENNKQQEREITKKGEKERSLKTAAFGVLHATSINSHSTAVKSRFEVLPGEQCPSTSSRCILPYQAPSHLERSETSHPPSITSDVKFLARGRGWVKIKNCILLAIPFQQTWKG